MNDFFSNPQTVIKYSGNLLYNRPSPAMKITECSSSSSQIKLCTFPPMRTGHLSQFGIVFRATGSMALAIHYNYFQVFLQTEDSMGCIFRIRPSLKVTTGDKVNYADQVKFESMATLGQYLHCSKRTFGKMKINTFSDR